MQLNTFSPKPRVAIFDFDGTIADSMELAIAEYNHLASRFRVRPIDRGEIARLRRLAPRDALREHRIPFWKLPLLVRAMRSSMRDHVDSLVPFPGMSSTLRALSEGGCRCGILSTNSTQNIERFLRRHQLGFFDPVAGGSSMFGKAQALKKLMRRSGFDPATVVYVGDEVRDITAARAAGVRSVAVSWGFADRTALHVHKPDYLLDAPAQLLELFGRTSR